jgi:septum formation topological specificity factor MinE
MDTVKQKLEYRRKQQIQFIVSQTNYDECEALQKLESCSNDVMKVVSDYLGITPKEDVNLKKTKNQKVYSVIRDIMDKGSNNYRMQQEKAKKVEEMNELIKRKQAYAAANANNAKKEEQPCNELENCNEKCVGCNATSCENYENCVKNKNIILKELKEKID